MSGLALGQSSTVLISEETAYGLICGLGVAFCGVILVAIKVQRLYLAEDSGTWKVFIVGKRHKRAKTEYREDVNSNE